jgi:hypothetical protein
MLFFRRKKPVSASTRISGGLWFPSQKNTINIQIPDGYAIEKSSGSRGYYNAG